MAKFGHNFGIWCISSETTFRFTVYNQFIDITLNIIKNLSDKNVSKDWPRKTL